MSPSISEYDVDNELKNNNNESSSNNKKRNKNDDEKDNKDVVVLPQQDTSLEEEYMIKRECEKSHTSLEEEYMMKRECQKSRSSLYERSLVRLQILETWYELAIRPKLALCPVEDVDLLLRSNTDDVKLLSRRCIDARSVLNSLLPPHDLTQLDPYLISDISNISGAGMGLFFRPITECSLSLPESCDYSNEKNATTKNIKNIIRKGELICHYMGHRHNFQSCRLVKDKSYLMLVDGQLFVDAGPLPQIKARYINDPLNESFYNCKFVPDANKYRSNVVALRDINAGEEFFASYGDMYWANEDEKGVVYYGHHHG